MKPLDVALIGMTDALLATRIYLRDGDYPMAKESILALMKASTKAYLAADKAQKEKA